MVHSSSSSSPRPTWYHISACSDPSFHMDIAFARQSSSSSGLIKVGSRKIMGQGGGTTSQAVGCCRDRLKVSCTEIKLAEVKTGYYARHEGREGPVSWPAPVRGRVAKCPSLCLSLHICPFPTSPAHTVRSAFLQTIHPPLLHPHQHSPHSCLNGKTSCTNQPELTSLLFSQAVSWPSRQVHPECRLFPLPGLP
ncbi:unnamed protein product [Protopolystoma xenopodis]|uniref:Uncharacterized protein n=1 Tax=Protopolystoma xenopodis TaxID=117903 RepID=A0A3S5CT49_9PLAT|nr:unnamed protein product [Protopolystoma xenopodis]